MTWGKMEALLRWHGNYRCRQGTGAPGGFFDDGDVKTEMEKTARWAPYQERPRPYSDLCQHPRRRLGAGSLPSPSSAATFWTIIAKKAERRLFAAV